MLFDIENYDNEKVINFLFLRSLIFVRGSWVGAAIKRPPSLKKRLGGAHPRPPILLGVFLLGGISAWGYFCLRVFLLEFIYAWVYFGLKCFCLEVFLLGSNFAWKYFCLVFICLRVFLLDGISA
jgi:hypothetical protein